eukprot:6202553-Pleurochrysis_carterae.AAC.3
MLLAAGSLAANCAVNEGGQLRPCGHGVVGVDAARKDLAGQLGADRDKPLKIGAKVGPAEVGREVIGPFVAQGGDARVCGDDVVDAEQRNQPLVALYHVKEARVVFGLGEAKRDEGLAGRLVPLASGCGVAVHVSYLCNHLAAVFPPLVALRDVDVDLVVDWPVGLRVGLGYITALHLKVMLSGDGKDGAQRGVVDGG